MSTAAVTLDEETRAREGMAGPLDDPVPVEPSDELQGALHPVPDNISVTVMERRRTGGQPGPVRSAGALGDPQTVQAAGGPQQLGRLAFELGLGRLFGQQRLGVLQRAQRNCRAGPAARRARPGTPGRRPRADLPSRWPTAARRPTAGMPDLVYMRGRPWTPAEAGPPAPPASRSLLPLAGWGRRGSVVVPDACCCATPGHGRRRWTTSHRGDTPGAPAGGLPMAGRHRPRPPAFDVLTEDRLRAGPRPQVDGTARRSVRSSPRWTSAPPPVSRASTRPSIADSWAT